MSIGTNRFGYCPSTEKLRALAFCALWLNRGDTGHSQRHAFATVAIHCMSIFWKEWIALCKARSAIACCCLSEQWDVWTETMATLEVGLSFAMLQRESDRQSKLSGFRSPKMSKALNALIEGQPWRLAQAQGKKCSQGQGRTSQTLQFWVGEPWKEYAKSLEQFLFLVRWVSLAIFPWQWCGTLRSAKKACDNL